MKDDGLNKFSEAIFDDKDERGIYVFTLNCVCMLLDFGTSLYEIVFNDNDESEIYVLHV